MSNSFSAVVISHHLVISSIFAQLLKDIKLQSDLSIEFLAEQTTNYSGSDLKEFCRVAVMTPIKEYMRLRGNDKSAMIEASQTVSLLLCSVWSIS